MVVTRIWPADLGPEDTRVGPPQPGAARDGEALSDLSRDLVLVSELGAGGMGAVYLAKQHSLDRMVAAKTVAPDAPPLSRDALIREARVTGALEHPAVVPIYALGTVRDGQPVLLMKRVAGMPWSRIMDFPDHPAWSGAKGWAADPDLRNIEILLEVCRAIEYAHNAGVVHRDIKPQNVMLGSYGEVYVVDWGIAAHMHDVREASDRVVGTLAYMAPEMLEGRADARTDVYLLGGVLHRILTGKAPHTGLAEEALRSVVHSQPRDYGPNVPAELAAVCHRAMAQDPAERFAEAALFRRAIQQVLQHRTSARHAYRGKQALTQLIALTNDANPDLKQVRLVHARARDEFVEALTDWEGNEPAREGMREALECLIQCELAHDYVDAADLHLDAAARWLPDDVERLRKDVARVRDSSTHLKRLLRELDPRISARERSAVLQWSIAIGSGLIVLRAIVARLTGIYPSGGQLLVTVAFATLVVAVALAFHWRAMIATELNRRTMGLLGVALMAMWLNRIVALAMGVDPMQTQVHELALHAGVASTACVTVSPRIWPVALLLTIAAILVALSPENTFDITAVCAALLFSVTRLRLER